MSPKGFLFQSWENVILTKLTRPWRTTLILISLGFLFYFSQTLYTRFFPTEITKLPPIPVETIQAKEYPMQKTLQTIGVLSGLQEAKLKAAAPGRVQNLFIPPGTWVEAGTLLINIVGGPDLRAPFSGFLTDYQVKVGEWVTSGTELVDLVNNKKMLLTYQVPEYYMQQLKTGQIVYLKIAAFKNKIFQAEVKYISPIIDKKTFTVTIKAELNNPDAILKSGMSAHVQHVLSTHPNALVIPEACLMPTLEGYEVLLIRDGKILRQAVNIGDKKQGRVQILSGVRKGESVVLTQNYATQEGVNAVAKEWGGEW